jgi:hypothetical protein
MVETPPYPCPPFSDFLETISRNYPQQFYKPLFACAASSKEPTVANHLCTLSAISRFLPDFWTRDAEMMSVALIGVIGVKGKAREGTQPKWGKAVLGQSVLLIEVAGCVRTIRSVREESVVSPFSFRTIPFCLLFENDETMIV